MTPEKAHYARIAALGCVVCARLGYGHTPAEIHHTKIGLTGAGQKSHWRDCIPLCPCHHRQGDGSSRFSGQLGYHVAPRTWESRYGCQLELLQQVRSLLGE